MNLFFFSLLMLGLIFKYMLVMLMIIELIVINMSMLIYMLYSIINLEIFMIYYLVFSICESVMGLTLLVLTIRYFSNDMFYSFNVSKFN